MITKQSVITIVTKLLLRSTEYYLPLSVKIAIVFYSYIIAYTYVYYKKSTCSVIHLRLLLILVAQFI